VKLVISLMGNHLSLVINNHACIKSFLGEQKVIVKLKLKRHFLKQRFKIGLLTLTLENFQVLKKIANSISVIVLMRIKMKKSSEIKRTRS